MDFRAPGPESGSGQELAAEAVPVQLGTELRGAGEFFGTRQHGEPQMPALMLTGDVCLLERTRAVFLQISRQEEYAAEYRAVLAAARRQFARSGSLLARN